MSKAEEKAMQYCCTKCANNKRNCGMKLLSNGRDCIECGNYIKGYHQAEKDLELGWEDIEAIDQLLWDLCEEYSGKKDNKGYYQEILKRFKERKQQ